MTTITPELLAEIREKAEKAVQHRSAFGTTYWSVETAPRVFAPYRLDLDPPTTLALVSALEEAQRENERLSAENEKLLSVLTTISDMQDMPSKDGDWSEGWNDALAKVKRIAWIGMVAARLRQAGGQAMKRSWMHVLKALESAIGWTPGNRLPDGNGRAGCARGDRLNEMKAAGVIEYGREPQQSHYGWRITEAGRQALKDMEDA